MPKEEDKIKTRYWLLLLLIVCFAIMASASLVIENWLAILLMVNAEFCLIVCFVYLWQGEESLKKLRGK